MHRALELRGGFVGVTALGINTLVIMILGIIALGITGCQWSSMQSPSSQRPYDRRATGLHPDFAFQTLSSGEVDVYLKLQREELLYTRDHAESPFVANVEIELGDTTWSLMDTIWHHTQGELRARWRWRGGDAFPLVQLKDQLRNATWQDRVALGSPPSWHRSNLLLWSYTDRWPLPSGDATVFDTIAVLLPNDSVMTRGWVVSHVLPPSTLPPPPYSGARVRWDTLSAQPLTTLGRDELSHLIVPEGITTLYHPRTDLGLVIHSRRPNFPALVNPDDLIRPVRYIASRAEFNALSEAQHPKMALDDFWLACGKSPDAARALLSIYYERVEEANVAFSGLTEGWMTDRGMVHIVFGVPQRVRKDAWNEYWVYGEEGTANALTFHFRKRQHPLDDNHFELQRSIQFRSVWDRAVSNWRNGRVRGD
jgi:GWxTD domain-containing protein